MLASAATSAGTVSSGSPADAMTYEPGGICVLRGCCAEPVAHPPQRAPRGPRRGRDARLKLHLDDGPDVSSARWNQSPDAAVMMRLWMVTLA